MFIARVNSKQLRQTIHMVPGKNGTS